LILANEARAAEERRQRRVPGIPKNPEEMTAGMRMLADIEARDRVLAALEANGGKR